MKTTLVDVLNVVRCCPCDSDVSFVRTKRTTKVKLQICLSDRDFDYFINSLKKKENDEANQG